MVIIFSLIIAAGLAFIPANIAKNKGHSFGLWWFYGWMLFIVAIIHVNFIPNLNNPQVSNASNSNSDSSVSGMNAADELKKYKELLDEGIITEDEFTAKKEQLLQLM